MFRRLKLFHRIFLHGILLIVALAVAAIVLVHLVGDHRGVHETYSLVGSSAARQLESADGSMATIEGRLSMLHEETHGTFALYSSRNRLLLEIGPETLPPLSAEDRDRLEWQKPSFTRHFGEIAIPIRLDGEDTWSGAYLLMRWHNAQTFRLRFVGFLVVVLLVIGAMSYPLARSIVEPVKTLTKTARLFRDGDLSARAHIASSDEMSVLADTMNEMAAGLTERIRREKELLAGVSHELRTPLARMRVAAEIGLEAAEQETVKHQLTGICDEIDELATLVDDVLAATRREVADPGSTQETLPVNRMPAYVFALVEEVVQQFEKQYGTSVRLDPPASDTEMFLDTSLFKRVLKNLLSNSYRYGSKTEANIEVVVDSGAEVLTIAVMDRGPGVDEDDLRRLFEPFFRVEKSRNKRAGGIGLGLTLCRRIVEAHGGKIDAKNREGGGLAVTIELPVRAES